jgi:hypothetical protein
MSESFGHSGSRPLPGNLPRPVPTPTRPAPNTQLPRPAGVPNIEPEEVELDPIGLVDEAEEVDTASKIKAFGIAGIGFVLILWEALPYLVTMRAGTKLFPSTC